MLTCVAIYKTDAQSPVPAPETDTIALPELLYEDRELWVFNKPAGVSLLADRQAQTCLWDTFKAQLGKPYLVHRLDKGTSGVLLLARTQARQKQLTRAFRERQVKKTYLSLVAGRFPGSASKRIDLPLTRGRKSRYRVAGQREAITWRGRNITVRTDREGLDAVTTARPLRHDVNNTCMMLRPQSGRSHQLRVHMGWCGFPILGDHLYGPKDQSQTADGLRLHCHKLVVPGLPPFRAPRPAWLINACG